VSSFRIKGEENNIGFERRSEKCVSAQNNNKKMFSRLQKMEMKATNKNVLTDKERR